MQITPEYITGETGVPVRWRFLPSDEATGRYSMNFYGEEVVLEGPPLVEVIRPNLFYLDAVHGLLPLGRFDPESTTVTWVFPNEFPRARRNGATFDRIVELVMTQVLTYIRSSPLAIFHGHIRTERSRLEEQKRRAQNDYRRFKEQADVADRTYRNTRDSIVRLERAFAPTRVIADLRRLVTIEGNGRVRRVRLDYQNRRILARVGPVDIQCPHCETVHHVGPFSVRCSLFQAEVSIEGSFHPHINGSRNGNICWGNGWGLVQTAISQGDFYAAFLGIREYLASYNPDDCYTPFYQLDEYNCVRPG